MHNGASHNGHGALTTPKAVEDDLLDKGRLRGSTFRIAVIVFAVLSVLGVVGFVIRLTDGFSDTPVWGYHAALFAFILTAAQGAPMVAIAPRIANAHWRRSISRVAELFSLVGIVSFIIYIPVAWALPSMEDGRRTLWFYGELECARPHAGDHHDARALGTNDQRPVAAVGVGHARLRHAARPLNGKEEGLVRPPRPKLGRHVGAMELAEAPARHPGGVLLHDAGDGPLRVQPRLRHVTGARLDRRAVPGHARAQLAAGGRGDHAGNDVRHVPLRRLQGLHQPRPVLGSGQAAVLPVAPVVLVLVLQLHHLLVRREARRGSGARPAVRRVHTCRYSLSSLRSRSSYPCGR